jgi:hypothetical protein
MDRRERTRQAGPEKTNPVEIEVTKYFQNVFYGENVALMCRFFQRFPFLLNYKQFKYHLLKQNAVQTDNSKKIT